MDAEVKVLEKKLEDLNKEIRLIEAKLNMSASSMLPKLREMLKQKRNLCIKSRNDINYKITQINANQQTYLAIDLLKIIDNIKNEILLLDNKTISKKTDSKAKNSYIISLKNRLFNVGLKTISLNISERGNVRLEIAKTLKIIDIWQTKHHNGVLTKKIQARQKEEERKSVKASSNGKFEEKIINTKNSAKIKNTVKETASEKESVHKIFWADVKFKDGYIYAQCKGILCKIQCNRSLEKFNYLKNSLNQLRNNFLVARYNPQEKNFVIDNQDLLERIFDRFEIEQILSNIDIQNSDYFSKTLLYSWNNKKLLNAYEITNRTPYLGHLCEVYSDELKIILVKENRKNESNENSIIEDTFLFPITKIVFRTSYGRV